MSTIAELFQLAARFHQGGDFAKAESLYQEVLQADPSNAHALYMLGLLAHQIGNQETALTRMRQALAINPGIPDFQFNLGIILMNREQFAEAAECFRQNLQINPQHVEGHINLGNALMSQRQFAEASSCYREALRLNSQYPFVSYNLGNALMSLGQVDEGITCYRQALRLDPTNTKAYYNLGVALQSQGQLASAADCFWKTLHFQPRHADALNNLGIILQGQGKLDEAVWCYRQSLQINPDNAHINNNLGIILRDKRQFAQATEYFLQALHCQPDHVDARMNLGIAHMLQGQLAEAIACYRQALCINPNNAYGLINLGNALKTQGNLAEAAASYQHVLNLDPGHGIALWNHAGLRLLQGDYLGGWPGFEQRWSLSGSLPRSFPKPRWDGSPLYGKTILLYAERGLGDTLQFIRYAGMVKERGGHVLVECQSALQSLLGGAAGVDQVFSYGHPSPAAFDVQVPLLSLGGIFGTTQATIPVQGAYLRPAADLVERWRVVLKGLEGFKIGIAWQGNPTQEEDRERSVPLAMFASLAEVPGVSLISLQVGPGSEQLAQAPFPVTDLGSRFDPNSLGDLAAVLIHLDLVVTVCTSVAHLAGALGVPGWVALRFVPPWFWHLERTDSPWYPTLRLFRQKKLGNWGEVFERIAKEVHLINPGSRDRGGSALA